MSALVKFLNSVRPRSDNRLPTRLLRVLAVRNASMPPVLAPKNGPTIRTGNMLQTIQLGSVALPSCCKYHELRSGSKFDKSQRKGSPVAGLERIERVSSGPVHKDETHGKIPNQSEDYEAAGGRENC